MVSLKHGGDWAERIRASGVEVFELHRRRRFELSRLIGLWRIIRRFRPDLVVTWLFTAATYGRLLSILAGVPHRISCERSGDIGSPVRLALERLLAPHTDCIVFNSRSNEEIARRAGVPTRLATIYNGVEPPEANPEAGRAALERMGVPRGAVLVGKVAQLSPVKDHDLFLQMAARLIARPELHFLIIGGGAERGRLENRARSLGLQGRVTFTGHLDDPFPIVSCLSVKVLTSHIEGMPNALMEAMALGVPCVVTAAGGTDEVIRDGVEGYIVRERDPSAFALRVEELLDHPERRRVMAEAARRRVREAFSLAAMVQGYQRLFAEVLAADERAA